MPVSLRYTASGASDPGLHRHVNEDRFHCDPLRGVFFVVDGVGGHAAGERAAEIAREVLSTRLARGIGRAETRLRQAITAANNEILRQASSKLEWNGMTCVLTACVVDDRDIVVGHVGDTRLYKLRQGRIDKLTRDHSPVGEREDEQELSELEAMRHPRRNEVYRDVGSELHAVADSGFVDVFRVPFEPDAALLLCSDGLTDCVTTGVIANVIEDLAGDPESVTQGLINAANRAGGKDNVTVVYVEGAQFVRGEETRELPQRREVATAHATSREAARDGRDLPARGRSRWRLLALVTLLLVTLGLSAYAVRDRLPPVGIAGSPSPGPRQFIVTAASSIGSALNQARPGDEILVEAGEFRERLSLRSGVRVRSRVPRAASIRLPGGATESDVAVEAVDVTAAELSGFRILGDAATPLGTGVLVRNADVTLVDLEVTGAQQAAVEFAGGAGGTLLGSHIHDNPGAGLVIRSSASPRIANTFFRQNGTASHAPGAVFVEPDAQAGFHQNVFEGVPPASLAVPTGGGASTVLRDNVFVPQPAGPIGQGARGRRPSAPPARGQSRGPR
jgi:serine/threonine protein phosphatase PrpC